MTDQLDPDPADPPTSLVILGAAAGMGRWLAEHLLSDEPWSRVTLVDRPDRRRELERLTGRFTIAEAVELVDDRTGSDDDPVEAATARPGALVVCAIPDDALDDVSARISSVPGDGSSLVFVANRLSSALSSLRALLPGWQVSGMHPLFEQSATSVEGQTVFLCAPEGSDPAQHPITLLTHRHGGGIKAGTAERHDAMMDYIQAAAHQSLLNFLDVLDASEFDIEHDLWPARTPLFESLFGLAARVLDPRQRTAVERIQTTPGAARIAEETSRSAAKTHTTIASEKGIASSLDALSSNLGGSFYSSALHSAELAVNAAHSTRATLSRHRTAQRLIGVRSLGRPDVLHVGYVEEVGLTELTMRDLLISGGDRGSVLMDGPGLRNARKLGIQGSPRRLRLNLGRLILTSGAELEEALDERLAHLRRDVRFLVPESISAGGVIAALQGFAGTRSHTVVSDVVRTGQRAVVVGLDIRSDLDPGAVVEAMRTTVQQVYAWPAGICRPPVRPVPELHYLGPAGTFSEMAAKHAREAAGLPGARIRAGAGFESVLAQAVDDAALAVVPIGSSSSGLVTRSFEALWSARGRLTVGGMVDVPIRLDAYVSAALRTDEPLRGCPVYSHPQALAQCRAFIQQRSLTPVECSSTAEAMELVAGSSEPAIALAPGGILDAALPLTVDQREVDDVSGSITRFLIVGPPGIFGPFSREQTPTTRSILLSTGGASWLPAAAGAAYTETLADRAGNALIITSAVLPSDAGDELPGSPSAVHLLGTTPWSPRTPIVRVPSAAAPA